MTPKQEKLMDLYWTYLDEYVESTMSFTQFLDKNCDMYIPPMPEDKSHEDVYCALFNHFGKS